jgi:hypothetical protein
VTAAHDEDLAKVVLRDGEQVETPWARKVGENRYVLDNIPWFAYRVSLGDTVEALPTSDGLPEFTRVLVKSGNRTLRILLKPSAKESSASKAILDQLLGMGCSYEGANASFVGVNIPPQVSLPEVCAFLTGKSVRWEHADPAYEDLHPGAGAA